HIPANQIGHHRWQAIVVALEPVVLDRHVLSFDGTALEQTLAETGRAGRRARRRSGVDEPDHRQCLLGERRHRPRCRATNYTKKTLPPHIRPPCSGSGNRIGWVLPSKEVFDVRSGSNPKAAHKPSALPPEADKTQCLSPAAATGRTRSRHRFPEAAR